MVGEDRSGMAFILKIPVGDDYMVSDDPDMHRVLNGHLYTDFATDSETILKKDGKPLFSFDGRGVCKAVPIGNE